MSSLLLGWDAPASRRAIGFGASVEPKPHTETAVYADRDAHLCTIAPTGEGKGRGLIIPALLTYPGSIICIDLKGENAQVTARYRRSIGQDVHILDPFGVTGLPTARLDPLDCLTLPHAQLESDAEALCEMLFPPERDPRHAFWDNLARMLLSGLLINAATTALEKRRTLRGVYQFLTADEFEFELAVSLDTGAVPHPYARRAFSQFLSLGNGSNNNNVRPDTLATARSHLGFLASEPVQEAVSGSTLDLGQLIAGRPMTVYIVMPPHYLDSHAHLLRAWIWALMRAILMRRSAPAMPTLFLLDEIAQLGHMPLLRQSVTLLRGFGVRVWAFWQNLAQMRQCYPQDWETMLDNSAVLQAFGINNHRMARELAELFGVNDPQLLLRMPKDRLVMSDRSGEPRVLRRPDYLTDAVFQGRFDANPLHGGFSTIVNSPLRNVTARAG